MDQMIYLDYNATTPVDERVLKEMKPFFTENFGNAGSTHPFGLSIKEKLITARKDVAKLINADPRELVFTSGATESINMILKGLFLHPSNTKRHIVTVSTEHKAVLDTCEYLETLGIEVTYLPVQHDGLIDLDQLKNAIREDTLMVSVMWVNNETGVIQNIKEISQVSHDAGAYFMTDATQAVGKIPVDVVMNEIDFMAFSGHKFYGPKGIGVAYINRETVNIKNILPLLHGGGQENGLRSGTHNVPAIIGLAKACVIAMNEMKEDEERVGKLRDKLEMELLKIKGATVNGSITHRIYNTSNICLPRIDANVLIGKCHNIAMSNGSACNSAIVEPSYVLTAMGLNKDKNETSLRFSLGRFSDGQDVEKCIKKINKILNNFY